MWKRLMDFFRRSSVPDPTKPAPSIFGADASNVHADSDRDDEWERQVAIQKGRVKGF